MPPLPLLRRPAASRALRLAAVSLLVLAAAAPAAAQAPRPVALALNWLPGGAHVPLYFGQSEGIFRKAGLDVTLRPSRGSAEALRALGQGAQFALAEAAEVYAQRAGEAGGLVGILAYFSQGGSAIISLRRPDLQRLPDLAGKVIGAPHASYPRLLFPELRLGPAFDLGQVRWRNLSPDELLPALLEGKVDAVAASALVASQYRAAAELVKKDISMFPYAGAGVNPYGLVLVTTEDQIKRDSARVRAMAAAVAHAAAAALSRPGDALRAFQKENPVSAPARSASEWEEAAKLIRPSARPAGLGRFDGARLEEFQALMAKLLNRRLDVPIGSVFTNRFLPGPAPTPPKP